MKWNGKNEGLGAVPPVGSRGKTLDGVRDKAARS